MNKFLISMTLLLLSGISCFSQSSAPERDFQVWHETQLIVPVIKSEDKKKERLNFVFYGTLRLGRNAGHFVDERAGFGLEFKVNKFLTLTPSYLYRAGQPFEGRKEFEHRLRFDVGLEKKLKNFSVKNRSRIEHRLRHSRSDSTRFRNKTTFTVPVKKNGREIFAPFVATEPFYEFQSNEWNRNEFSVGIGRKLLKNTNAEFFYQLQNNRGNSFKYVHIVGVNLKIKID